MLKSNLCPRCGEPLSEEGGKLVCRYCHASYTVDEGEEAKKLLLSVIEEAKLEALANRRRILWEAAHKPHVSTKEIRRAASDVREIYAEDRLARFYLSAVSDSPSDLNDFLLNEEVDLYDAREMVRFILLSLDLRNVLAVRNFVEKHFSGKEKLDNLQRVSDETEKLDQGVYLTSLPRHVFLAYSSADMDEVIRLADYLEEQGITCFVASRNLRHGKGSVENYEKALYDALSHCSCLVFVSSENSRSLSCDALTVELPFAQDNLPNLKRIQYVIEEPGKKTGPAVKTLLKAYFQGEEWITDLETLSEKVALCLVRKDKVCLHCHAINPAEATHCHKCGYPLDKEAYDRRVLDERKQQEALAKLAEIEKKQSDKPQAAPKKEPEQPKLAPKPVAPEPVKPQPVPGLKIIDVEEVQARQYKGSELESLKFTFPAPKIGDSAFEGCRNLKTVAFPAKVSSFGYRAFDGCEQLEKVDMPTEAPDYADGFIFAHCGLKDLVWPGSPSKLPKGCFSMCRKLKTAKLGKTSQIDEEAFWLCDSLVSLFSKAKIVSIGHRAFSACRALTKIDGLGVLKQVGYLAFDDCEKLQTTIHLAQDATVQNSAFPGCTCEIVIEGAQPSDRDFPEGFAKGWLDGFKGTVRYSDTPNKAEPKKPAEAPKEAPKVGPKEFEYAPSATPLTPQKSRNQLMQEEHKARIAQDIEKRKAEGREAFPFHSLDVRHVADREHRGVNWESIEFTAPAGLSVGVEAFAGCPFLKTVKFPVVVGSIWSHAFAKNPSLEYVTLPGIVTSMGSGIFEDCPKLHKVMIPANNSFSVLEFSMFKRCKSIETLPLSQLKTIRSYALQDCEKLASVKSEVGITEVGDWAFKGCKNLADIGKNVPLQEVGQEAFLDCVKLKSTIHLSHSALVGSAAFFGCSMDIVIEGKKPLFAQFPKGFDPKWLDGFKGTVRYSNGKIVFGNGGQSPGGSKLAKQTLSHAELDKRRQELIKKINEEIEKEKE